MTTGPRWLAEVNRIIDWDMVIPLSMLAASEELLVGTIRHYFVESQCA